MRLLALALLVCVYHVTGDNIFTSVKSIQNCLTGFRRHRAAIRSVLDKGIQDGTLYAQDDKADIEVIFQDLDKADPATMGHPLNAVRVIRRLKTLRLLLKNCKDKTDLISEYYDGLPHHTDEMGALHSLVRLKITYNLDICDIVQGDIRGFHAAFKLRTLDVLEIAKYCFKTQMFKMGLAWINCMNKTEDYKQDWTLLKEGEQIAISILNKHRHFKAAKDRAEKILDRYPEDQQYEAVIRAIDRELANSTPIPKELTDPPAGNDTAIRLCSGQRIESPHPTPLVCVYKPGILPYIQYKEELLSFSPKVSVFYEVVTESESQRLKDRATPLLERSKVGYDKRVKSKDRIGQSAYLPDTTDREMARLSRRVQDITGLSTAVLDSDNPDAEQFQVCNYGMGGQFDLHFDTAKGHETRTKKTWTAGAERPYRIATFLVYLSDVALGGGTVFPNLNLYIPPVKHAAAFWHNIRRSGKVDSRTLHAGCPVLVGDKWIANKWITEDPQMFNRPCGLSRDDEDPLLPHLMTS